MSDRVSPLGTDRMRWISRATVAVGLALLGALALASAAFDVAFGELSRDPASVGDLPAYVGILSHVGVITMSSSAAISIFGALVIARAANSAAHHSADAAWFLGYMGAFTALLAIDDALLVHDRLVPRLTPLPEPSVFVVYALVAAYGMYRFADLVFGPRRRWFIAALLCFAGSLVVDTASDQDDAGSVHFFFEDGFKFLGYLCWAVFFVGATWNALAERLADHRVEAGAGRP